MFKITTATVVALLMTSAHVLADDNCFVPMAKWQPRAAVSEMAIAQGWTVSRIKIDDGCYKVIATDANGKKIKVLVHPETLAILRGDDDRHEKGHEKEKDHD